MHQHGIRGVSVVLKSDDYVREGKGGRCKKVIIMVELHRRGDCPR